EERAGSPEEAESLLRARRTELDRLAAAVELSIEAAKGRLARSGDEDMWVGISEADLYCLRSQRPQRVARKYEQALVGASAFDEDSVRRQLEILPALGILRENAEAALAVLKSEPPVTTQPLVILFTGHRIDAPGRATPRFPSTNEPDARRAIVGALRRELER